MSKEKKMKTYVITLSRVFPVTHRRKGEPTLFEEKFRNVQSVANAGIQWKTLHELPRTKYHTIRANYPLWRKRFDQIEKGEAYISLRIRLYLTCEKCIIGNYAFSIGTILQRIRMKIFSNFAGATLMHSSAKRKIIML